jgi:hypothetical protein
VEIQVAGVVMTSSPGPTPQTRSARCSAEVPELSPTQCAAPTKRAKAASKASTYGPRMKLLLETTSVSTGISSSRRARC